MKTSQLCGLLSNADHLISAYVIDRLLHEAGVNKDAADVVTRAVDQMSRRISKLQAEIDFLHDQNLDLGGIIDGLYLLDPSELREVIEAAQEMAGKYASLKGTDADK